MLQYLHAWASANFLKNKPKALFLHLNLLAFKTSKEPGNYRWLQRKLLEAAQKEEGKRGRKQIVEPDPAAGLFGPDTATTPAGVGAGKLQIVKRLPAAACVPSSACRNQAGSSRHRYCPRQNGETFRGTCGCHRSSRHGKERSRASIPWQNKRSHQGQCHSASEGHSSHAQRSGPLVRTQQLLKDCTATPL